jgi:hypothetical protein
MVIFAKFFRNFFILASEFENKILVHFKMNRMIPKKLNFYLIWTKGSPLTPKNEFFFLNKFRYHSMLK